MFKTLISGIIGGYVGYKLSRNENGLASLWEQFKAKLEVPPQQKSANPLKEADYPDDK